jgi:hypothetical protein
VTKFGLVFLIFLLAAGGAAAGLRRGIERAVTTPGVAANERLSALTGAGLYGLLVAIAITIAFIRQLLPAHYLVGFALIPPLLLKLASTGYRFLRYYTGDLAYRLAGAPSLVLRLTAPVLVIATFGVFATGVGLWLFGLSRGDAWMSAHVASAVVMALSASLHALGHVRRSAAAAVEELRAATSGAGLAGRWAVVASLVAGIGLAAASLLYATPFPPDAAGR